ncbi:Homeobox-leucine zipper protein family [Quillaja saponaria]|uniref:Homeobox-leucine zipper protein family n=1 Tax=Quillaja saponaria TaxID=32244 RepID=A0AAD7M0F8_QUISA|nr:Homeobox-leucine zipper protein family [Quillaja saponaria]
MGTLAHVCNPGLGLDLGLGIHDHHHNQPNNFLMKIKTDHDHHDHQGKEIKNKVDDPFKYGLLDPSDLTLGPSAEAYQVTATKIAAVESGDLRRQDSSSRSAVSSLFSNSSSIKRDRESAGHEEYLELEKLASSRININSDHEDEDGSPSNRKKLRLTKEQAAILEDNFKEHTTLNPKQKQELARKLNLRGRQVEVWFQNRRARTKLKQTEVDYELLKKCCETLTEENKKLHKELQELKSLRMGATGPFYMQVPAATLTMCPFCQRNGSGTAGDGSSSSIGLKAHSRYFLIKNNPYTH